MSSLTLIELEMLADLLIDMMVRNPARREDGAQDAAQEAERRRMEEERIRERERRQEEAHRQQIRRLEQERKRYLDTAMAERERMISEQNAMLADLKRTVSDILVGVDSAGDEFVGDYANLVFSRDLYTRIMSSRQSVRDAARAILSEAQLVHAGDAKDKIDELRARVRQLRSAWESLEANIAKASEDASQTAGQNARFSEWLSALDLGLDTMRDRVEIFPAPPEDEGVSHAEAMNTALRTVEYYLYGPDSFYVSPEQKKEVALLYGVPTDEQEFSGIAPWAEEDIESRNNRFAASRRRAIDRHIFTTRSDLEEAGTTYARMRETLGLTDGGIEWDAYQDADALLAELRSQIEQLAGRVRKHAQRELVQSVIDRALRGAKRGMSVRRVGDEETRSGSWRGLYQIGQEGTTLEVFADARGNVSIETGALLENGSDRPTDAQTETILQNNRRFCSSELPLIVERLREELEAADQPDAVTVHETQGPEGVHIFRADRYANARRGAIVLREDGSAAAEDAAAAGTSAHKTRYLEDA